MPYIAQSHRVHLKDKPGDITSTGELNYMITQVVKTFLDKHGTSYATINNITGALENAKLEFYRRVAVPYEDQKIKEHGDVY